MSERVTIPETRSRQLLSTFWRGYQACKDGKPRSACPYEDVRGNAGHVTFARAFQRCWLNGWDQAKSGAT